MSDQDEVREFAEACGWTAEMETDWTDSERMQVRFWHSPSCGPNPQCASDDCDYPRHREFLPDFLHDLNACVEALEWFCRRESPQVQWELFAPAGEMAYGCILHSQSMIIFADVGAMTIPEAIIRAVVTADAKARTR